MDQNEQIGTGKTKDQLKPEGSKDKKAKINWPWMLNFIELANRTK